MFIQEVQKVISTFYERYVARFDSECGDYHKINSYEEDDKQVVEFFINDYSLKAWIDDSEELHIINSLTGESIFDYADEQGWDEDTVYYMKYGTHMKIIRASQLYIGDGMYVYAGQLDDGRYFVSNVFDLERIDMPDCIEYVDLCSKDPYIEDYDIDFDICLESNVARYTGEKAKSLIESAKKILENN